MNIWGGVHLRPLTTIVAVLSVFVAGLALSSPATAEVLAAPGSLSPSTGTTVSEIPTLSWSRVDGAQTYDLQISQTDAFDSTIAAVTTANVQYTPTTPLPAGEIYWRVRVTGQATWSTTSFTRGALAVPQLEEPASSDTPIYAQSGPLALSWRAPDTEGPIHGASQYNVQIGDDANFTDPSRYKAYTTKSTSLLLPRMPTPGTYYWRVQAQYSPTVLSEWSTSNEYVIKAFDPATYSTNEPISPPNDPTTDQSVSGIVFKWRPILGAASYELQVASDDNFLTLVTTHTGPATSYSPPSTLQNDQYWWRIRPLDSDGNAGLWSESPTWTFHRSWPDQPHLIYPADGDTVGDPLYFEWSPVRLASSYLLEIANNPGFTGSTQKCGTVHTTLVPGTDCYPGAGGTYYWRVTGVDDPSGIRTVGLDHAEVHKFTYDPQRSTLEAPVPGAAVSIPTMQWSPVSGAAKYRVTLTSATGSTSTWTTDGTSYTPRGLLKAGGYRWQVQTVAADGRLGAGTLLADQDTFSVSDPAPGTAARPNATTPERSYRRFPTLSWAATQNATRYVIRVRSTAATSWSTVSGTFAYPAGEDTGDTFLAPGRYEWQVDAYSGSAYLSTGTSGFFTITNPISDHGGEVTGYRAALAAHDLDAAPAARQWCDMSSATACQNLRQTPVLRWDADPDAAYYKVIVSRDATLTNKIGTFTAYSNMWMPNTEYADTNADSADYVLILACTSSSVCPAEHAATASFSKQANPVMTSGPGPDQTAQNDVTLSWYDYLCPTDGSAPPTVAPLTCPADAGIDMQSGSTTSLSTLPTIEARSYRVQVSTQPGDRTTWSGTLDDATVDQTTFTSPSILYPDGPIYWHVAAIDGSLNRLQWSATHRIDVRSDPPALVGATPAVGDPLGSSGLFTWPRQPFAAKYNFRVLPAGDSSVDATTPVVSVTGVEQAGYALTAPLLAGSAYRWTIQRVNASGRVGPWADPVRFDVPAPKPDLTEPGPADSVSPRGALFTWSVLDGATSYRYERATVGAVRPTESVITYASSWAPTQALPAGDWQWRVTALDAAGKPLGSAPWQTFTVTVITGTPPVVTGSGQVGTSMLASAASWNMDGVITSYQWFRGRTPIDGAIDRVYQPTLADLNQSLSVVARGHKPGYDDVSLTSNAVKIGLGQAPSLASALRLTGSAAAGAALHVAQVSWQQADVTTTYRWLVDGTAQGGATSDTFTLGPQQVGHWVSAEVTGTRQGYTPAVLTSEAVRVAAGNALTPTYPPSLSGTAAVGQALSAYPGAWAGTPTPAFSYQWLRDGNRISGATGTTYWVQLRDVGHRIAARVTAHRLGYRDGTATTAGKTIAKVATATGATLARSVVRRTRHAKVHVLVTGVPKPLGKVVAYAGTKRLAAVTLLAYRAGSATIRLPRLHKGKYRIRVRYLGSSVTKPSRSSASRLVVTW
ncbi:hypothetical protein [Nocardioides terrisoli]|uniref:hypothetical protein n=1 Tax=Nocardioides terrisoli TaxID=3388267 RepID=UPI00287BB683|nr:hypothetical protein [Nocardioides marmorisolisilvae]